MPLIVENLCAMILTFNEEPNIARTLNALKWAREILIVDSFSNDRTLEIVRSFPQARIVQRKFDTFAGQCNFGLSQITSEWVLSLDADYELTAELGDEIQKLTPQPETNGYRAAFIYCIHGHRLRGALYPPRVVLYRRTQAQYEDDGHAHHVVVNGNISQLRERILHDDRKPTATWLASQDRYAGRELEKHRTTPKSQLSRTDRLRGKRIVTPFLALVYALLFKGLILDGRPGFYYAFQRAIAEMILGMRMMEEDWKKNPDAGKPPTGKDQQ
ncbi:glycosyltransferase family 2 protein [Candidatus Sumerlaeota bacterium]|nr:glycosyltransferase family 2 protein [Candidatus Sumerlaeota bacterium]